MDTDVGFMGMPVLKMKEEAMSQGKRAASKSWDRQRERIYKWNAALPTPLF